MTDLRVNIFTTLQILLNPCFKNNFFKKEERQNVHVQVENKE